MTTTFLVVGGTGKTGRTVTEPFVDVLDGRNESVTFDVARVLGRPAVTGVWAR
jgi:hypothetical protein